VESLSGMIHNNALKSDITRYILMKEYGGLYFDIDFVCTTSFDNLFTKDNAIYIASSKIDFLDYIYPFSKPKYCSAFMAFEKEHPIWIKVIPILLNATTKYQVGSALDISLQNNNNYEIVVLNEIKAPYQCNHTNTICYTTVESSWNTIRPILQFINCNQAAVFIILMIIVMSIVMFFYNQNYKNVFNVIFKPRNRANKNKRRLSREI
jgi:mannosyltransferase OCH1-like enzyme